MRGAAWGLLWSPAHFGFELLHCTIWNELNGQYCHPQWAPPASCMLAAEPRTCVVDLGACEAKSCEKVTQWTTPASCNQVGEKLAACWHNVTIQTPKVCNEIVATECYPDVTRTTQRTLGYFNGTVSLTFGTTLGASVTGSYCDIWGSCRSWGLAGSVDLLQSGGAVCVDIPADAFPGGALFAFFSPAGVPRFCL